MIDIASETWSTIRRECEMRIQSSIEVVLREGVEPRACDAARGAIAAYRHILAMAEPRHVEPPADYSKRKDRSGI
jgi:hypothetical protein